MSCFIFTWNPKKYNWVKYQEYARFVSEGGRLLHDWSCGNTHKIEKGDSFYFLRLGEEPRGIIGSGHIVSDIYSRNHWGKEEGKTANYVELEFDLLFDVADPDTPILEVSLLKELFPTQNWIPQSSGIRVKEEIIEQLDTLWDELLFEMGIGDLNPYDEGKMYQVVSTRYERDLEARKACIDHFGYDCQICGINMEAQYGKPGKNYIQVHHIIPLSNENRKTKPNTIKDMMPICPNCHAMIHGNNPPYTPRELKKMITK